MPVRLVTARVYVPVIVIVLALLLALTAISYAAITNRGTGERLCAVLYEQIAGSGATIGKPGTPGFAYYQDHPMELAAARRRNREFLDELPCKGGKS